jgi:Xaa-Pro aminopeptidase
MPAILICGDTLRSPELRHEVPLGIGDPFLYLETDGRRAVLTNVLEVDRIAQQAPALERLLGEQFGRDELIAEGLSYSQIDRELYVRAVRHVGISEAVVPSDFPLAVADRLRDEGISLTPDEDLFAERRRRKTDAELAGIRRAAHAAVAGVEECARVLREAEIDGDGLRYDGEVLTSEALRARVREVCARLGAPAPEDIIVAPMRPGDAVGHESGSGPLPAHARSAWTSGRRTRRRAAGRT